MGSKSPELIKQCTHCHRVLRSDGRYHDFGFLGPINKIFDVPVSHTICSDCYEEVVRHIHGAPEEGKAAARA